MNVFELAAKLTLDTSEYEKGLQDSESKSSSFADKLKSGLATAGKVAAAGIGAAATAAVALGKSALEGYSEYEQLVGGSQLLFGDAYSTVAKNAAEAYSTVQMSQNEYLQQVNGFATGLKTALGGNEQAAADLAHKIIKAEADVVAATGNSQEAVQNAFNGIMKSNFTMLDNLQLGITPTKEGFQEVIDKVNDWNKANGEATKYQMGNLADMQSALVDYIEMQGLAGYASNEASHTIQGSLASMKAAWSNLVVGVADDNANLDQLIDNFINSVITAGENVIPRVEQIMNGLVTLIQTAGESLIPLLVNALINNLPQLVQAGVQLIVTLAGALIQALPQLIAAIPQIIQAIGNGLQAGWPQIQQAGREIINQLGNTIKGLASQALSWGQDLMNNFISGIKAKFAALRDAVSSAASTVKSFLGFSEPEKGPLSNFHTYAPDMMKLFAKGITDNENLIENAFDKSLDITQPTIGSTLTSGSRSGFTERAGELVLNITEMIDGSVLARNQYRYNLDELDRHGDNLINAYA